MAAKRARVSAARGAVLQASAEQLELQRSKDMIFEKLGQRPELIPRLLGLLERRP